MQISISATRDLWTDAALREELIREGFDVAGGVGQIRRKGAVDVDHALLALKIVGVGALTGVGRYLGEATMKRLSAALTEFRSRRSDVNPSVILDIEWRGVIVSYELPGDYSDVEALADIPADLEKVVDRDNRMWVKGQWVSVE